MSRRALYLDCAGGAAGDMLLGALADAADCADLIERLPEVLGFDDVTIEWPPAPSGGFAARRLKVRFDPAAHPEHRSLADVEALVRAAELPDGVTALAMRVFRALADAEAAVHGSTPDEVHFHEVGAVDAVIDIVGACLAFDRLAPDEAICSPLPMGTGTVECAHGTLPLPAPAVAALLTGVPVYPAGVEGETVTPTGAALVTTLADRFGEMPAMIVQCVGVGAGTLERPGLPNLLRAFVGELAEPPTDASTDPGGDT